MDTVLYTEINIFSMAVLIIIALKSASSGINSGIKTKMFLFSIWFAIAANFFDFLWKLCSSEFFSAPLSVIMLENFLYFLCFGCSAYFLFLYSETIAESEIFRSKGLLLFSMLPLVLLIMLLTDSLFTGCMFYFDDNMVYRHGSLYYMQQVLSYGYIVIASVKTMILSVNKKNYARREELRAISSFVWPLIICGAAQVVFQRAPLVTVGVVLSFLLVYINSVSLLISEDSLTGISNRRDFLKRLDDQIASLRKDENLYLLFIDIDSFKQINDVYGHNKGDQVLKAVARVLKKICFRSGGFCARYGGDEFAVIQTLKTDEDISSISKNICDLVEKSCAENVLGCKVSISIGCALYSAQTQNIHDFISCADSSMYENKIKNKNINRV